MSMEIINPVTGSSNTSLIREIPVSGLISLYRKVFIEPLNDHKEWYLTQVRHLKERYHLAAGLLSAIPASLYKNTLRLLKNFIEERNIMVEFVKI